jgi:hypothetical protein
MEWSWNLYLKAVNLALPKITLALDEIAIRHNKFIKLILATKLQMTA